MLSHLYSAQVQALPANQAHVQYKKQSLHTQLSACVPISITRFPLSYWQHPSACLVHVNCVAKRLPIQCVITSAANLHISVEQTLPSSQNSFKIANFAAKGIISCLFLRQLASPRRSVLSICLLFRQPSSKSTNLVFPTQIYQACRCLFKRRWESHKSKFKIIFFPCANLLDSVS